MINRMRIYNNIRPDDVFICAHARGHDPVLLYGCENWIMTEVLWERLEAFQGELAKRILKWPKHHSNTAAATTLEVSTMRCRVLIRKLSFLHRVVNSNSASLSGTALLALSDDTASICLVRECRELAGGGVRNTLHTRNPLRQRSPPQGGEGCYP